jgi:hypothetical protein
MSVSTSLFHYRIKSVSISLFQYFNIRSGTNAITELLTIVESFIGPALSQLKIILLAQVLQGWSLNRFQPFEAVPAGLSSTLAAA